MSTTTTLLDVENPHSTTGSGRERIPATATVRLPLTAALLDVAAHGVSFATPGHRGGRSCEDRS